MQWTLARVAIALVVATGAARSSAAQVTASLGAPPTTAAAVAYAPVFDALWNAGPDAARAMVTQQLQLQREGATLELASGQLNLLAPVNGRVIGFTWTGEGRFRFALDSKVESDQVERVFKARSLDIPISGLVVYFTDSTGREIASAGTLAAASPTPDMRDHVREALKFLGDDDGQDLHFDLMREVLNAESRGLFIAHIVRPGGDPLMFEVNPSEREGVRLFTRAKGAGGVRFRELVAAGPRAGEAKESWRGNRRHDLQVSRHVIEVRLPNSSTGDVSFSATDRLTLVARDSVGTWQPLMLFPRLKVDSATWADGTQATVFKGKDQGVLWVRLNAPMAAGDSATLTLGYAGDLTDRYGDFFYIKGQSAWYPRTPDYRSRSHFDITYRVPRRFELASVGALQDSSTDGTMEVTHWVTDRPVRNASFNFGLFKAYRVQEPGTPPVTVLWSTEGHRAIAQALAEGSGFAYQEKDMEKRVAQDVAGSIRFFQNVYGPAPMSAFYVTETPAAHGLAFPGLVHLSYSTFVQTSKEGWDEAFRAHEVAHQWWGIGVDFATYHDQWLSEGFSNFSGLWYLQAVRKKPEPYFEELRRWRADIVERRGKSGPISLGYRVATDKDGGDYQAIVYKKGAWVLHMLRTLMIDLKTMNEDRFTGMMRDFYQSCSGQYATTEDFQRTVETHVGQPMGWFFDQWVRGTAIPTYRVAHQFEPAGEGKYRVRLTVLQEDVPADFMMYVPVTVELGTGAKVHMRVLVKGPKSEPALPLMPSEPRALKFNDFEGVLAEVKPIGG